MLRLRSPGPIGTLMLLAATSVGCRPLESTDGTRNDQGGQAGGSSTVKGGSHAGGSNAGGASSENGGGTAGESSAGGTDTGTLSELLIDDFEDGDTTPFVGAMWFGYQDQVNGGSSVLTFSREGETQVVVSGNGYDSKLSLAIDYRLDKGTLSYDPYVGIGVSLGSSASPYDISAYNAVVYTYKGNAHRLKVQTFDVTDYDYFGVVVPASTTWTTVTLPFAYLTQEGWGKKATFRPANVDALTFQISGATGGTGALQVDNVKVVKRAASTTPDMTVNPAAFPTEVVIDPITIENPLQAKAEKYLTRGYNITNWLEQDAFTGFTYDEAWVKLLAQAGFKSLRLPIDLDRYIETTTGTGDNLTLTVSSDLYTILDSFDNWTKNAGLSLTIDYHQYDKSLAVADSDSLTKAVKIWGKVAEHFAANTREDLFFELLNEPDLAMSAPAPTSAQWTALAERMIASIRAFDTTHTLIFGDVEWYSIDTLVKRELLSDSNVIYAFHDYDPFIFTHQGAAWSNMASTHDLPYPYAPERWSGYYADLGFTPAMESWILSAAKSYYVNGSRSALRNHVVAAKRWAVEHNVPIICNEFGAYDGTSRLEDRARYYSDFVGILDELKIPWQQWFKIMDSKGTVIPEYRAALKLGQ